MEDSVLQIDSIIQSILTSYHPRTEITFSRHRIDDHITYNLIYDKQLIGKIGLHFAPMPTPSPRIIFSDMTEDEELVGKFRQLCRHIQDTIEMEQGTGGWGKVYSELESTKKMATVIVESKLLYKNLCKTTPEYLFNLVKNFTHRYSKDIFDDLSFLSVMKFGGQFQFYISNLGDFGIVCVINIDPINDEKAWVSLILLELSSFWLEPDEVEIGLAFSQELAKLLQASFGEGVQDVTRETQNEGELIAGISIPKKNPWELIPDHYWDRAAIKMWCKGYTNIEIARRVNVEPKSVTNRISQLRKEHPAANIPTNAERRKLMIRDDTG